MGDPNVCGKNVARSSNAVVIILRIVGEFLFYSVVLTAFAEKNTIIVGILGEKYFKFCRIRD